MTLGDASMLIVASVVGAGIFFTPPQVAGLLPDARWILLAWLVGAVLSFAGALANAELGAMFPRAGGDYVYLTVGLHPAAGFLVGWLSFFAIYAGTIAALALILGDAIARAAGLGKAGQLACAAAVVLLCSAVNVRSVRLGASLNNITSLIKIGTLLVFAIVAPIVGDGSFAAWAWSAGGTGLVPTSEDALPIRFGAALSPVLFSFLGWNASVYVASEIKEPRKNVPRSLFVGLAICTGIYLLINLVYFYALPPAELMGATDAGEAAARALLGNRGGDWIAVFVLVSVLGTLNATVLVGPRIAYAMALDGHFPGVGERVHEGFRTPNGAIWIQAGVSIALILFLDNFPDALDFTVFAIVLATSADVVALIVLRIREPERFRPYRTVGYPWIPGLYVVANLGVAAALLVSSPRECAVTLGLLAAGLLMYIAVQRRSAAHQQV